MLSRGSLLALSAIMLKTAPGFAGPLPLVAEGEPAAILVLADTPAEAAREAAGALRTWIEKMSGARLPVLHESDVAPDPESVLILVGDTERTRALDIDPEGLGLEEVRIRTFPGAVAVVGDDLRPDGLPLRGTLFAAGLFAREVLGIRWLWPGTLGEVVPRSREISVPEVRIRQTPRFRRRDMFNQAYNGVCHSKIDALGWDHEPFLEMQRKTDEWQAFHGGGGSYDGSFGHAFGHYWDLHHEEHPDWFALQPDGTRDNEGPANEGYPSHRLCVSNPGLIERVARDKIEQLKRNPFLDAASVSPNDGGLQTFCLCERCEAWDAPGGEMIQMRGPDGPIPHVTLSDRFVRFYSDIARIVARELPDRNIGAYAYHHYTTPPIHAELHPNVVIGFVTGMRMYVNDHLREKMRVEWRKWAAKADQLFLYSNSTYALNAFPSVYVRRLGEDLRFYAENDIVFAQYDCVTGHWGTNGLNYYVLARLLWDPGQDVDALVEEYCAAGFGPAAGQVRGYFEEIERITAAVAGERRRPGAETMARHYSDEAVAGLSAMLDAADLAAAGEATIRARIGLLRQGLDYAPICRDYMLAREELEGGNKWDWRAYREQSVRRTTWFHQLGPSWSIHVPWLMYREL